jgi:hypothetical protein
VHPKASFGYLEIIWMKLQESQIAIFRKNQAISGLEVLEYNGSLN